MASFVPEMVQAQSNDSTSPLTQLEIQPFSVTFHIPYVTFRSAIYGSVGTHVQALGIDTSALVKFTDIDFLEFFYLYVQTSYFYSAANLGIPGGSHTAHFSGALGISIGEQGVLRNNFFPLGERGHNVIYQYGYYLDSIHTSQAAAMVAYIYSQPTWLIGMLFENDNLAFLFKDRFRTSGIELVSLFKIEDTILGVAVGNKYWTGDTNGETATGNRTKIVNISQHYGGQYSHGIVYASFYVNFLKISIGWDDERIRQFVQNGIHWLFDLPQIAPIPSTPRLYVQLEINPRFSLY